MSETSGPGKPDFKADMDALVEGAAGLFSNLREIFDKSRDEIARASRLGKTRLDLLQLEKDREHFLRKLGEVTLGLMADGEVAHDGLTELAAKISALDVRKAEYDAEVARVADEQAEAQTGNGDAPAEPGAADAVDPVEAALAEIEALPDAPPATKAAKKPAAKKPAAKKPAAKKPKKDL